MSQDSINNNQLVKKLRNSITLSEKENEKYAVEFNSIPLVGKTIFEQQKLLYMTLLEWLDLFENQFYENYPNVY